MFLLWCFCEKSKVAADKIHFFEKAALKKLQ